MLQSQQNSVPTVVLPSQATHIGGILQMYWLLTSRR